MLSFVFSMGNSWIFIFELRILTEAILDPMQAIVIFGAVLIFVAIPVACFLQRDIDRLNRLGRLAEEEEKRKRLHFRDRLQLQRQGRSILGQGQNARKRR